LSLGGRFSRDLVVHKRSSKAAISLFAITSFTLRDRRPRLRPRPGDDAGAISLQPPQGLIDCSVNGRAVDILYGGEERRSAIAAFLVDWALISGEIALREERVLLPISA